MAVTIAIRRDDSADWIAANPVLALGEMGIETDTNKAKYGDGFAAWQDLPYFVQPQVGAIVPDGTADGQTLRWEVDSGEWEANDFLTITDAGNVGIGTDAPISKLDTLLQSAQDPSLTVATPAAMEYAATGLSGLSFWAGDAPNYTLSIQGRHQSVNDLSYPIALNPLGGNVGIGTATPIGKLTVSNNIDSHLELANSLIPTGVGANITSFDRIGVVYRGMDYNALEHRWFNSAVERMRIDTTGALLVGTTVLPDQNNPGFGYFPQAGSERLRLASSTADDSIIEFFTNTAFCGRIRVFGSSTEYVTTSDERLKENIVDAAQFDIMSLRVREFDWLDGNHETHGFIAQELNEVYPRAVTRGGDVAEDDPWGVDNSKLIPVLVKAIQEQQAQIDELKALIEAK